MIATKSILNSVEKLLTGLVRCAAKHPFNSTRYRFNFPEVWYSPWRENADFQAIYGKISSHTLISERKLFDLFALAKQVGHLENTRVLEIGSYRGGSGTLLSSVLPERPLTLWDNWGKPVVENDYFIKKTYAAESDLSQAQALLNTVRPQSAPSCEFVSDLFPNKTVINAHAEEYSLIHFDIYDETAFTQGMELVWPKLCIGGMFICGGYGAISLDALTTAINLFVKTHACTFVQSQSGLGVIIKR